MAGKPIKISVLADTRDLQTGLGKAESSLDSLEAKAKTAGAGVERSLDGVGDGADTVASKGSQAAGALAGLGDLVGGKFGTAMVAGGTAMQAAADAGDLLNVAIEGGGKLAAKAVGGVKALGRAETYATGAKKASAAAQRILNAVMRANPLGLVITAITLLVGAFILAYKKSETFRRIVNGAFDAVKSAATTLKTWVVDKFQAIVTWISEIPGKISGLAGKMLRAGKDFIGGMWDGIVSAAKNAGGFIGNLVDAIKTAINNTLHLPLRIDFDKGPFNIHQTLIPALANGGIVTGPTLALIGEAGPEAVVPLNGKFGMGGNVYKITVVAPVGSSSADIGRTLVGHIESYERAGGRRRAT